MNIESKYSENPRNPLESISRTHLNLRLTNLIRGPKLVIYLKHYFLFEKRRNITLLFFLAILSNI